MEEAGARQVARAHRSAAARERTPGPSAERLTRAYHQTGKDGVTDTNRSQLLRHPARLASSSLLRLQSDERLATLAVDDHEAAFAAIVDRYRAPLLRYCSGIVGPSRAEDAVQQTLISAHDALTRTTEVRHLRSWLYRIAHNTSLNVLRSVRDDVPLDPSHALADGPDAAFERAERLRETLAAVGGLPERQRAALLLRELEGRSHEEIATALGVTKGSARQSLMRARTAVRSAVTAVTPYPLIAKLTAGLASSGPAVAGWGETAAGVGAGATLAKLTAGVVATGALVGGAVGTDHVVHRGHHQAPSAEAAQPAPRRAAAVAVTPAVAPTVARAATGPARAGRSTAALRERRSSAAERRRAARRHGAAGVSGDRSDGSSGDDGEGGGTPVTTGSSGHRGGGDARDDTGDRGKGKGRDGAKQGGDDDGGHGQGTSKQTGSESGGKTQESGDGGKDGAQKSSGSGGSSGSSGDDRAPATTPTSGGSGGDDGQDGGSGDHSGSSGSGDGGQDDQAATGSGTTTVPTTTTSGD